MASYSTEALVLSKTKLGDSDLILTLLASDGRCIRAVAKGARKTRSKLGGTVEVFSQVDLLMAEGRNLDVVVEARTVDAHEGCRRDLEHSAAASTLCEMLTKLALEGQRQEYLYEMECAALTAIARCETPRQDLIVAAALFKTLCLLGYRPSLAECTGCGRPVEPVADGTVGFSSSEGGVVCDRCDHAPADTREVAANLVIWLKVLFRSTFDDLVVCEGGDDAARELLRFCEGWLIQNTGVRLKAIAFLYL